MYWMIIQTRLVEWPDTLEPEIDIKNVEGLEELREVMSDLERNDMNITAVPLSAIRQALNLHEPISNEIVFASVELASGIVMEFYDDFDEGRRKVEEDQPSRWHNPILIATPRSFRAKFRDRGEGEMDDLIPVGLATEDVVVAVPNTQWGYGKAYRKYVEENQRRFKVETE